ncbi:MAG TPA: hypothetical protein VGB18_05205, partial [Candidatus Thermoplasmatota archaeon]
MRSGFRLLPALAVAVAVALAGCNQAPPGAPPESGVAEFPAVFVHDSNGERITAAGVDLPKFVMRMAPRVGAAWGWEPTVAADDSGTIFLPTIDSYRSDVPNIGLTYKMRLYRTLDEGVTWTEVIPTTLGQEFPPTGSLDS